MSTIELSTFRRNFAEWRAFKDTFLALIHKNESLSDVRRLCYLKSSVKGDSYNMNQSLETIKSNFQVAWKLISDRFSHHRRIIFFIFIRPTRTTLWIARIIQNPYKTMWCDISLIKFLEIRRENMSEMENTLTFVIKQKRIIYVRHCCVISNRKI